MLDRVVAWLRGRRAARADTVRVIGARRAPFRDLYHAFLWMPWSVAIAAIAAAFCALNAAFAGVYLAVGGVEGVAEGSFLDAFYFSVETMATIGYGVMHPVSRAAHLLVIVEAVVGIVVTALATGLLFAKFSRSTARIVFSREAVIGPMDGKPTLMFRMGNERGNSILEATIKLVMIRTDRLAEGAVFYRMIDVPLARERSPAFARSWTALHVIDDASPLWGWNPERFTEREVELLITVVGTDDTSMQPVHARHTYVDSQVIWGARHVDILAEQADGSFTLDLTRFHDTEPTAPLPDFPYPRDSTD